MEKERNLNYDLIRLLGLSIIMVAHSSPPDWLFQLRNFGTPLLVIGSGLTYALIYSSKEMNVGKFYKKRLTRLIFAAWIFLSFFFLLFYVASEILEKEYPFQLNQMLSSYSFMNGIGFVWVFKIYLMLALTTPIAIHINRRINSDQLYFSVLIAFYIIYELLNLSLSPYLAGAYKGLFDSIIFILLPYFLLYLYAFRMAKLKSAYLLFISFSSFIAFVIMATVKYKETGGFVPTQKFKYPPTIYYLSYAFFAINLIFLLVKKVDLTKVKIKNALIWLSSNSLWIYLWHIFAFYLWVFSVPSPNGDLLLFLVKTIFLFSSSIMFTIFQNRIVSILSTKSPLFARKFAPLLSSNT